MVFYQALGVGVFFIGAVVAIVLFSIYKKIYPVFYVLSVALYIFTAGFVIDVYHFGRFGILLTLIFSAIIFMFLGYYLSRVIPRKS
ncbi:hypothetical protein D6817_02200 [Candidatus Pacearchaeota archaeon]|nr:MAG: hypothetical protein D6817_02200 [Candidatus Pacearchaeota archaeon]